MLCVWVIFQRIVQVIIGLKGKLKVFSFDSNATDTSNVLDIYRYFMKET